MIDAEAAIRELLTTYGRLLDAADYDGVGELFSDGALLDPDGRVIARGHPDVAEFYRRAVILYDGSPQTEHATTDEHIEIDDDNGIATARSRFTTHQLIDGRRVRVAAGRYADEFASLNGMWRFTIRRFFLDDATEMDKHLRITPQG